jgi:deoxycytidylate deaminase
MNDAIWKNLLRQISGGLVVPVLGPRLLVAGDGESLQRRVAERLLNQYGVEAAADDLPPFRELNAAVARLKSVAHNPQDLYADIHDALRALTADDAAIPQPIRQLAQISDFRLFVTLTPDDLLARCLRQQRAVNEIVYSPRLPTSEFRDLPRDWHERPGEVQLLYLFGKSHVAPMFAIHDEDVLEYAHNLIARGSQVPNDFLGELQERSLLLIGCNFPDWLSRFFLRLTNKGRLSEKTRREWLIDELRPEEPLTCFLLSYSKDTEILGQISPPEFVAELHRRWMEEHGAAAGTRQTATGESVPRGAMFFISYSRGTDLPRAEALFQALLGMGVTKGEVWFDRQAIEPGQDFSHRIYDGIAGCRYFLPLLSEGANRREEAFVFREWRAANERRQGMNREFVYPLIVDPDNVPERYTADPVRAWSGIHYGHAPEGAPDVDTAAKLKAMVRDARRGED